MASEDADREMENSNSESEHDSDEDLAVLELIDASSSDDDEEDDKEDVVRRQPDRRNRTVPESDRATSSSSSRVDRPLSALVEEDVKVKRYPNKTGTFVTGIDVLSKEAREKRSKRADRFGLSKQERKSSPDGGIEDIAGVTLAAGSKIDGSPIRLEAIHLRGVDDMSTKDIFNYFRDYMPSSIEWVDDSSCNVVWLDHQSTARALAGMSSSQPRQEDDQEEQTTKSSSQRPPPPGSDEEPMEEDDEDQILDLISNKETGEKERIPKSPLSSSLLVDTLNTDSMQSRPDSDMSEQAMECLEMVEADMRPVEIKSKDILRIGKAHPKADELVMRYASIDDRKQKGAYKHSQYYLKYGNPNFGGYKGLVSLSKRQQYRDGKYQPATSDRRKRRHGHQEDWEAEEEESLHPRKRKPDEAESKGQTTDLRERLKKGTAKRHSSGSEGEEEEDGEKRGKEDAVDEEAENLDAELKHAMGNVSPKRKMQMYADEVEAELKKFREEVGHQEPLYKVRDAREGLKNRLSVRDRLGHIRGAPTPASSLENLKIIVDTQDDISEKSSSEEEEEEEEEEGEKSSKVKGALHQDDDLRAWLHNRETSRKLLENLPSLKIEVQDDT